MSYDPNQPRDDHGRWGSGSGFRNPLGPDSNDYRRIEALGEASLRGSFTPGEREALNRYGQGSNQFNEPLRKNLRLSDYQRAHIANLDLAFKKSFLPEELEVFRVIHQDFFDDKLRHKIGVPLIDRGFMSTTISASSANELTYALDQEEDKAGPVHKYKMMKLIVPKGYPAVPMTSKVHDYTDDKEILLKRGTRFKLLDRNNIQVLT